MSVITHNARIIGPVSYTAGNGQEASIPPGPCLIEQINGELVDIIWGKNGEKSTVLTVEALEAAELNGRVVLLD